MTAITLIVVLTASALGAAVLVPRLRASLLALAGYGYIYVGQRLLDADSYAVPVAAFGLVVVAAALVVRFLGRGAARGVHRDAEQDALVFQLVSLVGLAIYGLTLEPVVSGLGLDDDGVSRWTVSWSAVWPIVWTLGAAPMLLLDLAMGRHPVRLPAGARQHAVASGLAVALAVALVFPVNYLAASHDVEWDFSYFRVTRPGTATEALVSSVDKPVEVLLFYPVANDVKEKILPYFRDLERASEGKLTVREVDQPMEPKLSEELGVRDNGFVVVRQARDEGDPATEKFKLDANLDKAKRDLKKLDETFQKHLLKLVKGKRTAYMLAGHGEASPRDEDPKRKLGEFKNLLRAQNYDVKDFSVEQGSTVAVPDDAALVIVAAPTKALLPEETETLKRYVDKGGALLVYVDVDADPLDGLLGHLGLKAGPAPLANESKFVQIDGGQTDRYNLAFTKFGVHPSVATLSKYASRTFVAMLGAVSVDESGAATAPSPVKTTALIRSFDDTWADLNRNAALDKDAGEAAKMAVVAQAVEGPETAKFRAIVVGDASMASDFVVTHSTGSAQFLVDGVRWLVGDEDLSGETQSEEDVRIEHTRADDVAWFYGTVFGVPVLLLLAGVILVRSRNR
ncbi:MAG TPA: Gldg family protein [Myxococcota bacterium]|nr:Gldg family protein [Myxococcota bacterium]